MKPTYEELAHAAACVVEDAREMEMLLSNLRHDGPVKAAAIKKLDERFSGTSYAAAKAFREHLGIIESANRRET